MYVHETTKLLSLFYSIEFSSFVQEQCFLLCTMKIKVLNHRKIQKIPRIAAYFKPPDKCNHMCREITGANRGKTYYNHVSPQANKYDLPPRSVKATYTHSFQG